MGRGCRRSDGRERDAGVVADLLGPVRVGLRVRHQQAGGGGAQEGADPAVAAEDEERKAFAVVPAGLPEREQGEAGGGTAGRSAADDDQVGAVGFT